MTLPPPASPFSADCPLNTSASTRLKLGLGVADTVIFPFMVLPVCIQLNVLSPTLGMALLRRTLISSFSTHTCPNSTSDKRCALFTNESVARMPASSAIDTMPSATSTSISVKPVDLFTGFDRRLDTKRANTIRRQGQTAGRMAQQHFLRRNDGLWA